MAEATISSQADPSSPVAGRSAAAGPAPVGRTGVKPLGRTLVPRRMLSDERLAALAAEGDRDAFEAIFRRYHQPIYRYCRSLVGTDADAADALQSTMTAALRALPGERREVRLRPWLYRVAHNESISRLRARPTESLDAVAERPGADLVESAATRERLRELVADLGELSDQQRGMLVMRELSDCSHEEIADAFGVSVGAAKQTVYKAREALQAFEEGRRMDCAEARRLISERDGRRLAARHLRSHLRACRGCRDFRDGIRLRRADMPLIAPMLPAAAAAEVLSGILGGGGGSAGGGLATLLGGGGAGKTAAGAGQTAAGAGKTAVGAGHFIGGSLAAKSIAAGAAAILAGGGAIAGIEIAKSQGADPAATPAAESAADRSSAGRGARSDGERRTAQDGAAGQRTGPRRGGDRNGRRTGRHGGASKRGAHAAAAAGAAAVAGQAAEGKAAFGAGVAKQAADTYVPPSADDRGPVGGGSTADAPGSPSTGESDVGETGSGAAESGSATAAPPAAAGEPQTGGDSAGSRVTSPDPAR